MLEIERELPVEVVAADGRFDAAHGTGNLQTVRLLNSLELGGRNEQGDKHLETVSDLSRIEIKLDALLSLVGALLAQQQTLPPIRPVRLSVEAIEIRDLPPVDPDVSVCVTVYPSTMLATPLRLHARIAAPSGDGEEGWTRWALDHQDTVFKDELERYIFLLDRKVRHHQ